jgi:hypothetical protein
MEDAMKNDVLRTMGKALSLALGFRHRDFNGRETSLSVTAIAGLIGTHYLYPDGVGLVIRSVGHCSHGRV